MSLAETLQAHKWAMESGHLEAFVSSVAAIDLLPIDPVIDAEAMPDDGARGPVVEFEMRGPMMNRVPDIFRAFGVEAVDMDALAHDIRQAAEDEGVERIVLRVDSPGGMVSGLDVLAQSIRDAREMGTEVIAQVEGMMASAALWAGSQADRIVASELSEIGSIGVYTVLIDTSRAADRAGIDVNVISSGGVKGGGVRGAPISEEVIADNQRLINDLNDRFVAAVAEGRGMPEDEARRMNTGQVWVADDALTLGLIDEVSNNPQAAMPAQQQEQAAMSDFLNLAAENPDHIKLVASMEADGASIEDVKAAIEQADKQADHEAHIEALATANADLESEQEARAEAEARVAELEAEIEEKDGKLAALTAVAETGDDPGADNSIPGGDAKQKKRDEFNAMRPKDQGKFLADGGQIIDEE